MPLVGDQAFASSRRTTRHGTGSNRLPPLSDISLVGFISLSISTFGIAMNDGLLRAYSRLEALKRNLPKPIVLEHYVTDYHAALQHIADLGVDIEEFRIP